MASIGYNPSNQVATSQQPMSLLTINANPNGNNRNSPPSEGDLLTIRILEASERKMQLIKRLLSPEDYNSLASSLFRADSLSDEARRVHQSRKPATTHSVGLIPSGHRNRNNKINARLSKSEMNLNLSEPGGGVNLQESLAKRREALAFFFDCDSDQAQSQANTRAGDRGLSMELRSGYYLAFSSESEDKMINYEPFSWYDRLVGLLGLVGISLASNRDNNNNNNNSGFIQQNKTFNSEPYTRDRNMAVIESRLRREHHYEKLARQRPPKVEAPERNSAAKQSELVNLARLHSTHSSTSSSSLLLAASSSSSSMRHNNNDVMMDETNRIVATVGHFNRMQLKLAKKLTTTDSRILVHHPALERLVFSSPGKGRKDLSSQQNRDNILSCGSLLLEFKALKFSSHKLITLEQQTECKLIGCHAEFADMKLVMDKLNLKFLSLVSQMQQEIDGGKHPGDASRSAALLKLSIVRLKFYEKVLSKQQELLARWNELQAIRAEQGYTSTSVKLAIDPTSLRRAGKPVDAIERLMQEETNSRFEQPDLQSNRLDFFKQLKANEHQMEQTIAGVLLKRSPAIVTPNSDCPQEEQMRRKELSELFAAIRLKLLLGDEHFCHLKPKVSCESSRDGLGLRFECAPVAVEIMDTSESLQVEVEVYDSREKFRPKAFARSSFGVVPCKSSQRTTNKLEVQFEPQTDQRESKATLELTTCFRMNQRDHSRLSLHSRQTVDYMYKECFEPRHPFEDTPTKLAKLLNQVDVCLLLAYFTRLNRRSAYLVLDPHLDRIGTQQMGPKGSQPARPALLAWRWANNLSQQIHLSDRENIKKIDFELEKYKWRTKSESLSVERAQKFTLKTIEHIRSSSCDFIRRCESNIEELLSFNAQQRPTDRGQRVQDLLQEPQLKVDLSGLARTIRLLMPRKTARRPLMPKRGARQTLHRATMLLLSGSQPEGAANIKRDLESEAQSQWQRFVQLRRQQAGNLRLVVTIQHALNVPLRLARSASSTKQQMRSGSPFYPASPSAAGGLSFSSTAFAGQQQHQQLNEYLAQPNTYVEVVFQRKQMASSLVQGKNPAWNETLFFPVDLSSLRSSLSSPKHLLMDTSEHDEEEARCGQLVDEYMQLNLYDCRCYQLDPTSGLVDVEGPINSPALSSPAGRQTDQSLQANRLLSVRQRIERHLIGSLRIPLTTLLSSGRIEGSFALSQPLLLDEYQFESEPSLAVQPTGGFLHTSSTNRTFMSLFVTLDPPVSIPLHIYLPTGSHEEGRVFEYARQWEQVMSGFRRHLFSSRGRKLARESGNLSTRLEKSPQAGRQTLGTRHVRALVMRDDARYCVASRYLYPIEAPQVLLDRCGCGAGETNADKGKQLELQMNAIARFVSLLSPLKYGVFRVRLLASNLWFDCHQLVDRCLGGPEEKAILLCNYFLHLGKCSALLLGDAVPAGRCVFVITWNEQSRFIDEQLQLQVSDLLQSIRGSSTEQQQTRNLQLVDESNFVARLPILINSRTVQVWDPESGGSFQLAEQQLPLVSVGSIVTPENVYANIQVNETPNEMNFDVRLKQFWAPLFEQRVASLQQNTSHHQLQDSRKLLQANWRRQLVHLESVRRQLGGNPLVQQAPLSAPWRRLQFNYDMFTSEQCNQLRESIERSIKSHLLSWRPDRPTYFNRTLSRLIADKLATFESQTGGLGAFNENNNNNNTAVINDHPQVSTAGDWRAQLSALIREEVLAIAPGLGAGGPSRERQVISWPVNLAYTSTKTILDGLFASGVHNADLILDSQQVFGADGQQSDRAPVQTQFLLACHIEPYPARVLSVWLYVGAVVGQPRTKLLV